MREDACGYEYPEIDLSRCVDCGLCERVCPALHPLELREALCAYACAAKDSAERGSSSSGGFSSVAGRWVLEQGGVVYGCAQYSYCDIRHIHVERPDELPLLKGSKYVQSSIGLTYRLVKEDLDAGRTVLFSGTPCQVAGLKRYLRREYPRLYLLDLVCHGVPPQRMLREDVESYFPPSFPADGRAATSVHFRWKTQYGIQFGVRFGGRFDATGTLPLPFRKGICLPHDPYILAFSTGLSFRECCHVCPYARLARVGDLTVGDFWGLGAYAPTRFRIREGVSLALPNTEKGRSLWNSVAPLLEWEERSVAEASAGNANLHSVSPRPRGKDRFLAEYPEAGLARACRLSVSRGTFLKLACMERLKRLQLLVATFKRVRLMIHKMKNSK